MNRITASDARRHWFQILDRVAAGEVIVIDRNGRRIVLRREDETEYATAVPNYTGLIRPLAEVDRADRWWNCVRAKPASDGPPRYPFPDLDPDRRGAAPELSLAE